MIIHTENLGKLFRTEDVETTALDAVNISVEEGEFVSIMGPSGGGKSTLMNIMGLVDQADSGHYFFRDEDVAAYDERKRAQVRRQHIGFVFQSFNLIDELTVFENVELPLVYDGRSDRRQRREKAQAVLERLDMLHRMKHFPQQLSGGQQQRVAVARAIVNQPDLILADEPTGNLDSEHGSEVMDILAQLNKEGTTIVMVTHAPECSRYADRVVRLLDGRVVAEETVGVQHAEQ
ncbi:MAG: ABC transporter ATP-binding protein [Pseudomonadales bacterium]